MLQRFHFPITLLIDVCSVKDFVNLQHQARALCNMTAEWQNRYSYYILPSSGMRRLAVSRKFPQSRRNELALSARKKCNSTLTASPPEGRHRHFIPQERWQIYISLDGVTLQPTIIFAFATVRTSIFSRHCKLYSIISVAKCWSRLCSEVACVFPQSVHVNPVLVP